MLTHRFDPGLDPQGFAASMVCCAREHGWPRAVLVTERWGQLGPQARLPVGPRYRVAEAPGSATAIEVQHDPEQLTCGATPGAGRMLDRFAAQPWFHTPEG